MNRPSRWSHTSSRSRGLTFGAAGGKLSPPMSEETSKSPAAAPRRVRGYNEVVEGDRSNLLGQVLAQRERVARGSPPCATSWPW